MTVMEVLAQFPSSCIRPAIIKRSYYCQNVVTGTTAECIGVGTDRVAYSLLTYIRRRVPLRHCQRRGQGHGPQNQRRRNDYASSSSEPGRRTQFFHCIPSGSHVSAIFNAFASSCRRHSLHRSLYLRTIWVPSKGRY